MSYIKAPKPEQQEMYDYLEELRQSGDTNMFGASPYLAEEFGISKIEARNILSDWMRGREDSSRVLDGPGTGQTITPGKMVTRYESGR